MARPLRLEYPGSFWHVTSRGNEKRNIVYDDADRQMFVELLGKTAKRFDWLLYSWTMMTNHYHLVLELTRKTLARGLHWLNGTYVGRFNRRHARVGHLFQSRPKCILVEKEGHWLELLRYVVLNPVRAGMVEHPAQYPWSSYRATVGDVPAPSWLALDQILPAFGSTMEQARTEYRRFVEAGIGSTACPWDQLTGQIYLGSETWMEKVQKEIRKKPRSDEHPRRQRRPVSKSMAEIVSVVASRSGVSEDFIRHGRGGMERMVTAWLARYECDLDLRSIAAGLRLRSSSRGSGLIQECDGVIKRDVAIRTLIERCQDALHAV